jgi:hypothetical protein
MGAVAIQQIADRVAQLMDERLAVRGRTLGAKLQKGGKLLPRRIRDAAANLAEAAQKAQHPQLLGQIDMGKVAEDYDVCVRHLTAIDPAKHRQGAMRALLVAIAWGVLAVIAIVGGFMLWKGYL